MECAVTLGWFWATDEKANRAINAGAINNDLVFMVNEFRWLMPSLP